MRQVTQRLLQGIVFLLLLAMGLVTGGRYWLNLGLGDTGPLPTRPLTAETTLSPDALPTLAAAQPGALLYRQFLRPDSVLRPAMRVQLPEINSAQKIVNRARALGLGRLEVVDGPDVAADRLARMQHLLTLAQAASLPVDFVAASGSALGGDSVTPEDTPLLLTWAEQRINQGKGMIMLAMPQPGLAHFIASWQAIRKRSGEPPWSGLTALPFRPKSARPLAMLAARTLSSGRNPLPWVLDDQVMLERDSVRVLGEPDEEGMIGWELPDGRWRLLEFWLMPSGERSTQVSGPLPFRVVDPFDPAKIAAVLDARFPAESRENPAWRGLVVDRPDYLTPFIAPADLLTQFRERRGYDLAPWLPAIARPMPDHRRFGRVRSEPEFRFGDEDWRVWKDFQRTRAELYTERFGGTLAAWAAHHGGDLGLQSGGPLAAVMSMARRGPRIGSGRPLEDPMDLRLLSSAAVLHGRPVVTAGVPIAAGTDLPVDWKARLDRLYLSGVNDVVWSGDTADTLERSPFVKQLEPLSRYAGRAAQLLQAGPEQVDVLVYYPFAGLPPAADPELAGSWLNLEPQDPPQRRWLEKVRPLLESLQSRGIRWAWVDDASLRQVETDPLGLSIRGNAYRAVLFAWPPHLQRDTLEHLAKVFEAGASLWAVTDAPVRQAGWRDHAAGDELAATFFARLKSEGVDLADPDAWSAWMQSMGADASFRLAYPVPGLRSVARRHATGRVLLLRNEGDDTAEIRFSSQATELLKLDLMQGQVRPLQPLRGHYRLDLKPGASAWLLLNDIPLAQSGWPLGPAVPAVPPQPVSRQALSRWELVKPGPREQILLSAASLQEIDALARDLLPDGRWVLRRPLSLPAGLAAGELHQYLEIAGLNGTAEVLVNGKHCGTALLPESRVDLTPCLSSRSNTLELQLLGLVENGSATGPGKGRQGSTGLALTGPVTLASYENSP